MYDKYEEITDKCKEYIETCTTLRNDKRTSHETIVKLKAENAGLSKQPTGMQSEAISKALVDAEIFAQRIIDLAKAEAKEIIDNAKKEVDSIKKEADFARTEKLRAVGDLREICDKLTSIGSNEAAKFERPERLEKIEKIERRW
jgi:cell division septum initiation protein DivIVA